MPSTRREAACSIRSLQAVGRDRRALKLGDRGVDDVGVVGASVAGAIAGGVVGAVVALGVSPGG